jgi:hypothetical protein
MLRFEPTSLRVGLYLLGLGLGLLAALASYRKTQSHSKLA